MADDNLEEMDKTALVAMARELKRKRSPHDEWLEARIEACAQEREACARLADGDPRDGKGWGDSEQQAIGDIIAAAIRARGKAR